MNVQELFEHMKIIHNAVLKFLDNDNNEEENFQNLQNILNERKIIEDKHELVLLLHLILKIGNYHKRGPSFFNKIEQILVQLQDELIKKFSNHEIFNIFESNKRILLFLIEKS